MTRLKRSKTIAILFHETVTHETMRKYRMWHLAQLWEQQGHKIKILIGPAHTVDADLLIPQIDISVIPDAYRQFIQSFDNVINRSVFDIRKSRVSKNLVALEDDYAGPVIVKTDENAGGAPERAIIRMLPPAQRFSTQTQKLMRAIRKIVVSRSLNRLAYTTRISSNEYPVLESKSQLPEAVFNNKELVVERFLPEKVGDIYYSRSFSFFGSKGYAYRIGSPDPIIKSGNKVSRETIPIDDELVSLQHELGFDQAKFDYVMHDGKIVLLDTNDTPMTPAQGLTEAFMGRLGVLASGLEAWL